MNTSPSPFTTHRESFANDLVVRFEEHGSGRPMLVLHGGGGPQTVLGLVRSLSEQAHVLVPTHPGFEGEPRPEHFASIGDLALTYLELLARLDLREVIVIGSSIGGWIAAEMAVRDASRLSGIILIDAVGIQVDNQPITDVFSLAPQELTALSFHNPAALPTAPATMTSEQLAIRAGNFQALKVYDQGQGMADPTLRDRLARVELPVLVVWGESDRVATPDYGRAYARSFPHARFELITEAGHLPQIEQPTRLHALVSQFALEH
ncbi:alpha/beta fold hydrolase [Dictyobacter aurantiacus]|uniref:Alpha/beta hydrolase n=1 Tax=Dictyobacter aurantiacus TaxID=1936993 RepID=A0A401ZK88_9CHLR|nr:alpha/beta hydrolase [Dictyobacter aurantiacus]GCE07259.1 alpha/beta hydrolase [Dictyobacter aurantiacus]